MSSEPIPNFPLNRMALKDPATAHCRIYVGNLVDGISMESVYEHFQPYGKILDMALNRGFGFIQFEDEASATEAKAKEHGTNLNGKSLVVNIAITDKSKSKVNSSTADISNSSMDLQEEIPYQEREWEGAEGSWDDEMGWRGGRGGRRGMGRGGLMPRAGRGGPVPYRERSPLGRGGPEWPDRGYERYPESSYLTPAVPERNDCEIIVVSKMLTEYAEFIESRLKRLGLTVDLLFPMEDVPIGKVLGNIATRGCLYAILVMPQNQEHRSLTLNILHGLPQEHRNMPLEDALQLIGRNYAEASRGGGGREAMLALLGQLADGKSLTALQYDKVIQYLQERREIQVKVEVGEVTAEVKDKTQVDLQQRIMSILNDNAPRDKEPLAPLVAQRSLLAPTPLQRAPLASLLPTPPQQAGQPKILSDPTVQKALDSFLQKFI